MSFECFSGIHYEMAAGIDVDKDIAGFISAVVLHIMVYSCGIERHVVTFGESEHRPFCLIGRHGEISSLSQSAVHPCTVVVNLIVCKEISQLLLTSVFFGRNRFNRSEIDQMCGFQSKREASFCWNCYCIVFSKRNCTGNSGVEDHSAGFVQRHIVFGFVRLAWNERCSVAVSVKGDECLAAGRGAVAYGDRLLFSFFCGDFYVERVITVFY